MFKKPLWQTVWTQNSAPIGAVCSGSTLFASILNPSVMLGNYLQQTTSADDIFRCIFFLALIGSKPLDKKSRTNGTLENGQLEVKLPSFPRFFKKESEGDIVIASARLSVILSLDKIQPNLVCELLR